MKFLRQSTALTIVVGPFVDKTTALPITTLTDQSANGRLVKNGTGSSVTATSWVHDSQGHYLIGLSIAHTDTVGRLRLAFYDSATYLPVWEDFSVLAAAVYDVIFGSVAPSTYAGGAVASVTAPVILAAVTHTGAVIPTVTTLTNLPAIPANWLTATGIAAAALNGKGNWLAPTVAGRTLDVTATGEAGIDWANIGGAGTAVNLSGTTISTGQIIASVTVAGYDVGQDPATLLDARFDAIDAAVAGLPATGAAMTLTVGERDAIAAALLDLASGVETDETLRQLCRRLRAFSAGLVDANPITGVDTFLRKDGATPAFSVTHDANGNRTTSTDGTL